VLWDGRECGELRTEREGLYTRFSVTGSLPDEKLWCAWVVGERCELRLGVLEPEKGRGVISRRFSGGDTAALGRVLRCELRRAGETPQKWTAVGDPAGLFHAAWLRSRLSGMQGALTCRMGKTRLLALPWEKRQPFPLTPLFCFAKLRCIGSRYYLVFAFDGEDRPVFEACEKSCEN